MTMCLRLRDQRGFTLIELMVVIVILGLLATLILPRFRGSTERARRVKAIAQMKSIETALRLYELDNGFFPTTQQGLEALVRPPAAEPIPKSWREGGYLEGGRVPLDPWSNPYVYISPGTASSDFDLLSLGSDGAEGGEGKYADISSTATCLLYTSDAADE